MRIALTQGKFTEIDEEDFDLVNQFKWQATLDRWGKWYAVRRVAGKTWSVHRLIMIAQPGQIVDHRDSDGLNNRRSNLRFATPAQNAQNARRRKDNKTGFSGVTLRGRRFWAHIKVNRKRVSLGYFDTLIEAAVTRRTAELKFFGEFAPPL